MSSPYQPNLISVIIPVRNEASSMGSIISKSRECLAGTPYEIVVIDDGSTDETGEIARRNGAILVSHKRSVGKGAAMKTGVQNASGGVIVFLDGDGAHNPCDIPKVTAPILEGKADLVIGSRNLPESKVLILPLTRRISNNLASLIISVIISFLLPLGTRIKCPIKWTKITDCTSGFRAIKKEGWLKINLASQGFEIETEMIYEAAKNKLRIVEVPISCDWNSQFSSLSILKDGPRTLKLLAGKFAADIRRR